MEQHNGDENEFHEIIPSNVEDESYNHPLNDAEEQKVLLAALDSYRQYRKNSHYNITHQRRQNIYALPQDQWKLLAGPPFSLLDTLSQIDDAIDINADLADAIFDVGLQSLGIENSDMTSTPPSWHNKAKSNDHAKAYSTIRQFYRDWSAEGFQREVKPILDLILADLLRHNLPPSSHSTILLPGTGLGRLLFELTLRGYHCTGNEISYHQILASNYILNHTPYANCHTIHPFLSTFTNNLTRTSQLSSHTIPDIHPSNSIAEALNQGLFPGTMSMTSGDFILSYSQPSELHQFDAVVTVYFIDTSPNLFRYISTVKHTLKPGGLWMNVGPLLWHFDNRTPPSSSSSPAHHNSTTSDPSKQVPSPETSMAEDKGVASPGSFELTHHEVLLLLSASGFEILSSEENLPPEKFGNYIQDPNSMVVSMYRCVHWVARKL